MPTIDNIVTRFLGIELFVNEFIFIDIWSGFHLITGFFLLLVLSLFIKKTSNRLGFLFILLVFWEFFEFVLYGMLNPPMIASESFIDVFTDIWIALLGGLIAEGFLLLKKI